MDKQSLIMVGLGQIFDFGSTILDKFFPDKDEREKAKLKLLEMQQNGELKELETRMSAIVAEAKSADPWTSRARPTFLYVIYVMILAAIPMGVVSALNPTLAVDIAEGMKAWLGSIPDGLWATFGIGYSGYSVARSMDKRNVSKSQK
jgi:hypothetical protein